MGLGCCGISGWEPSVELGCWVGQLNDQQEVSDKEPKQLQHATHTTQYDYDFTALFIVKTNREKNQMRQY